LDRMKLNIKWLGVDFGQCIMDPSGLRNPLMFGEIMRELGRPEEIAERIHRYRRMKEKYQTYSLIKEGHRPEIREYVFDNDAEAWELFAEYEQRLLMPAEGIADTLAWLREQGIICDVVAELKKTLGPIGSDHVTMFLRRQGLSRYFDYFYSPSGRVRLRDGKADFGCKGKDKTSGTMYDYLLEDLARRGIDIDECAIIGDKPSTDIEPSRRRGFHTIQFTGYIDMGCSEHAEYRVESFPQLRGFVTGVK
jgi:FMN phosphatase YigB (HAD superfamily)